MGPTTFNGIPAHPLWVHAVVVLVPLSALLLVLCAGWPAVMRRAGIVLPLLAGAALVSVPLATQAGEWLQERVAETAAVERRTEVGDGLLPWSLGVFVLAVALWVAHRGLLDRFVAQTADGGARGRWTARGSVVGTVAVLLGLVMAAGAVVQVYRIGDSGATAVWRNR
ncbi:DUF2231 domain-containing protein [Kitasatospora cineracea]|uniref:DUF2231 domain-containing protein n=1 Tax=Kitasatospora cineracea TaxID=88074 RepID=UPI0033FE8DAA